MPSPPEVNHAHAQAVATVEDSLGSSQQGLSHQEAQLRLQQYGSNTLPLARAVPAWKRLLRQFHNLLIYILLIASVISLLLQNYVDTGVILAVVLVNAAVGFIQEGKAEAALRSILSMTTTHCSVVRDGVLHSLDSAQLVPGDVVLLQAGDRVPADMRLFFSKDLQCDESALTGESQPVEKTIAPLPADRVLAERSNMAFMATLCTRGTARGYVTQTGQRTEIGAISSMVQETKAPTTPLQKQLARFAQQLTMAILIFSAATILFGILVRGYSLESMFQAAISIAVAAIPEGLPAIVTIALAMGVQRMAGNKALVRRLPSVEVLGAVNVICSDKTGTLTTNTMTARELVLAHQQYRISGDGYGPHGSITHLDNSPAGTDAVLEQAARIASLCNDSSVREANGDWLLSGDPTEGALLALGAKGGQGRFQCEQTWPRIDELPFDSERRYMATLHQAADGQRLLAIKGAPDRLISSSTKQLGPTGPEKVNVDFWQRQQEQLAASGMRILALAQKDVPSELTELTHEFVGHDLVLLALVGISDPPRPEVIDSIQECHQAGIRVKMITGDSPVTARAIGAELGLNAQRVVTGAELDRMNDKALQRIVLDVDIFARTSPANKLQLIKALQTQGHIGAMTGDGVNDAPALRRADIGVAMGKKGTDAAKEAADIVLTDDNFRTISEAVKEGRTVYDNIVKSILFILPTSVAEAAVIIVAILLGYMLPITPVQILWINMVTNVTLALALAFEPPEPGIMKRAPRPRSRGFITMPLLIRILLVGFVAAGLVFWLFASYQHISVEFARTLALNMLVMIEAVYLINCRLLNQSIFTPAIMRGMWPSLIAIASVVMLQLLFTYLPVSQAIFELEPIGLSEWLLIAVLTLPVLLVVEVEKFLWRRFAPARALGT